MVDETRLVAFAGCIQHKRIVHVKKVRFIKTEGGNGQVCQYIYYNAVPRLEHRGGGHIPVVKVSSSIRLLMRYSLPVVLDNKPILLNTVLGKTPPTRRV